VDFVANVSLAFRRNGISLQLEHLDGTVELRLERVVVFIGGLLELGE